MTDPLELAEELFGPDPPPGWRPPAGFELYTPMCGTDPPTMFEAKRIIDATQDDPPETANRTDADHCGCWRQYDHHPQLGPVAIYRCAEHADRPSDPQETP